MNAFRKLLLAPALLGLVSPMAVQAQSLDMGTVDRYTQQQDIDRMRALEAQMGQVTSVSQFSDVQPTDWAYQALSNLVEQYGCVAGYPDGTFKGNIAMTRYEAAALLNACLDRVTEMTAEIKRLMKEFEKELSVLKAKVDGLEAQTAELAATQFSTTTKLTGRQYFWIGGAQYSGDKSGKGPLSPSGDVAAERKAMADANAANGLNIAPGGSNYNFGVLYNNPYTVGGIGAGTKALTKAATWSGATGSTGVWTAAGNASTFTGNAAADYGNASLANITVAGTTANLTGVAGGAASSATNGGTFAGLAAGPTGQLAVSGLRSNGLTPGTPGFKVNLPEGTVLTPNQVRKSANAKGTGAAGVTFSTFTLGASDMANLVRLGNAARRAKGASQLTYQNSIVPTANGAAVPTTQQFTTTGYQIATGGAFENANIYTDPFNASVAEYGTLSKAQANTKYVKKAARKFLKGLYQGDVELGEAVSFNYDTRLFFNTSFTGKDLMRIMLRAGSFGDSTWGGNPFPATGAEIAFEEPSGRNSIGVNRAFYQFPVGENFTLTGGAVVRQDDMLAVWPSQYPAETILDFFTYAGAPGTYSLNLGSGAGGWWAKDGWSVSANYVAANGFSSYTDRGGLMTEASGGTGTAQLAYTGDDWNLSAAYAYNQNGSYGYIPVGTPLAGNPFAGLSTFDVNSLAISGWYAPSDWGDWMPSVSAGWGTNSATAKQDADVWGISAVKEGNTAKSQSWYVGLQWSDVLLEGNFLGTAVGQPTFVSSNDSFMDTDESTFAWEIWYKFQVTDNVAVTPAFFYINNPSGLGSNSAAGGVLKTTINF